MIRMTEPDLVDAPLAGEDRGLFVYGVVDARAELPEGMLGVDDEPLGTVVHGDLAAVVASIMLERPPGRRADLLSYNGALDAIAEKTTVVPVAFGSVMADEASVIDDLLVPRAPDLAVMLQELAGRAQFTFQARYLENVVLSEIVAEDRVIEDLRRRTRDLPEDAAVGDRIRLGELVARAIEHKRDVDAELLLEVIVPLTAAHVVAPVSGLERVLEMSVLVDDDRQQEFENALETLAEGVHERMRLRLMGPMAPYDFVRGD